MCETFCPRRILKMSTTFNAKGYYLPEVVDAQACVACGLCQIMCPEFAIYVTEVESGRLKVEGGRLKVESEKAEIRLPTSDL